MKAALQDLETELELADHTHTIADISNLDVADFTPKITGATAMGSWGTDEDDVYDNMTNAEFIVWDTVSGTYKKNSVFSMWQAFAVEVAESLPDLWDTELGSSSNPADLDGDGTVGISDVLNILSNYGAGEGWAKSFWICGMDPVEINMDNWNDSSTVRNPSVHCLEVLGYTPDTWKVFDLDMQDSGGTIGGANDTISRFTGTANTEWDSTDNKWVGFSSNDALAANYTLPGKELKLQFTFPPNGVAYGQAVGIDEASFKIVVTGYDDAGSQLTFDNGDDYEYEVITDFQTQAGSYFHPYPGQIIYIDLEPNDDMDSLRVGYYYKSLYGKVTHVTMKTTVNLIEL